ncbi:hypothetical protein FXW07_10775 [Methanosarcina sp. DH1]|nr:hypothetical protein [Methanosarcina sp. DH1]MCC4767085.1 hypothetical protein [Methanosarcina sp. DH1]
MKVFLAESPAKIPGYTAIEAENLPEGFQKMESKNEKRYEKNVKWRAGIK